MKIIKLKKDEANFLKSLNNSLINTYLERAYIDKRSSSLILNIENSEIENIADTLTELILNVGITNNEINKIGIKIDDIISKFDDNN
jgi:hypothetical protein